jgi:hypothetical protein
MQDTVTNAGQTVAITLVSSVRQIGGQIVPERFTSISTPVGASLISPELGSTSTPVFPPFMGLTDPNEE